MHEINILWATHVVHHSSEHFNLTTGARKSIFTHYSAVAFEFPLALLGIPYEVYYVHDSFSRYWQTWCHSEIFGKLPYPIEFIFNTPSHHRVHHGSNPYCIDKNYGGLVIFYDRIFGTFAEEKEDEPVKFGLVHNIKSYNQFTIQFHHFVDMYYKFIATPGFVGKLKVIFYGPGWDKHNPSDRLGDYNSIPEVNIKEVKYDPAVDLDKRIYGYIQFLLSIPLFVILMERNSYGISKHDAWMIFGTFSVAQCTIGMILNGSTKIFVFEFMRLLVLAILMLYRFDYSKNQPVWIVLCCYLVVSLSLNVRWMMKRRK